MGSVNSKGEPEGLDGSAHPPEPTVDESPPHCGHVHSVAVELGSGTSLLPVWATPDQVLLASSARAPECLPIQGFVTLRPSLAGAAPLNLRLIWGAQGWA